MSEANKTLNQDNDTSSSDMSFYFEVVHFGPNGEPCLQNAHSSLQEALESIGDAYWDEAMHTVYVRPRGNLSVLPVLFEDFSESGQCQVRCVLYRRMLDLGW